MKALILIFGLTLCTQFETFAQTEFELSPSQSMLMTGKGSGQDGTINPYNGEDCYAIVENIGKGNFSMRIQKNGEIIKTISVLEGKVKRVKLLKGQELYLDSESKKKVKARIRYRKINE